MENEQDSDSRPRESRLRNGAQRDETKVCVEGAGNEADGGLSIQKKSTTKQVPVINKGSGSQSLTSSGLESLRGADGVGVGGGAEGGQRVGHQQTTGIFGRKGITFFPQHRKKKRKPTFSWRFVSAPLCLIGPEDLAGAPRSPLRGFACPFPFTVTDTHTHTHPPVWTGAVFTRTRFIHPTQEGTGRPMFRTGEVSNPLRQRSNTAVCPRERRNQENTARTSPQLLILGWVASISPSTKHTTTTTTTTTATTKRFQMRDSVQRKSSRRAAVSADGGNN